MPPRTDGAEQMNRLTFTDKNQLMRFVADCLKRGDIGICLVPLPEGGTEVRTWDKQRTPT